MKRNEIVYVCSPLNAPTQEGINTNMKLADIYMKKVKHYFSCRAIAPHAFLPKFINDNIPQERELGLDFGLGVLKLSSAIAVCGDRLSPGMKGELKAAYELKKPIYVGSLSMIELISEYFNLSAFERELIKVVVSFA